MASLLDKTLNTAKGLAKAGAKAAFDIVAPGVSPFISGQQAGQVAKELAQSTARGYAGTAEGIQQVGAKVAEKLTGKKFEVQTITPTGKVQQAIFGTDKSITSRSVGEEIPFVKKGGKLAPVLGTVMGALDLIPGGTGGKGALVQTLTKLDDVADVARELKAGTKFADNVIDDLARKIAKTKEVSVVKAYLDNALSAPVGARERGFITSVKESRPEIADRVASFYIPRSTDKLAMQARSLIRLNPDEALRIASQDTTDRGIATASELIKYYTDEAAKAGDEFMKNQLYDQAASVAHATAARLTESGRAVQAASILSRLTPEGQLRFAAREIERYNEELLKNGSLFGTKKPIPQLTSDQVQRITSEMYAIQEIEDATEKAMRFQELQRYVKDLVPTPLFRKLTTVWKAGLLTGLKTSGLNIFSNISHAVGETAKDLPASVIDTGISLFTGKRSTGMTLRGSAEGAKEGFQKGWQYLKTGFDERNMAAKLDQQHINFGKGTFAKALKRYTETVFRIIGAEDQPFYYGAFRRSLADQAKVAASNDGLKGSRAASYINDLIQKPTDEMLKYAMLDAETAVFQNSTKLGEWGSKAQKIGPFEFVIPFAKTPSAVAMQVLNYSPVGAVSTILKQIVSGTFDQRALSQGLGRAVTGTAVMWIGKELFDQDRIALDTPKNEGERKLWEQEGRQKNSIKIGDEWRSVQTLGPFGQLVLFGAHLRKNLEETGSATEALYKSVGGAMKSFTESTFLQGIQNVVEAAGDPERYLEKYISGLVSSFIPTIVSDAARATDPLERRREGVVDAIASRIPGARQTLEPQVTILGEERERAGNPLETILDPTRPSEVRETPVTVELRRLSDAGYPATPTQLGNTEGYEILTPEQNTKLWKRAGQITNDKLSSLFGRPEYKELDDEEKKQTVERFTKYATDVARAEAVVELTDGLTGEALRARLKELKEAQLYTEAVYKIYKDIR